MLVTITTVGGGTYLLVDLFSLILHVSSFQWGDDGAGEWRRGCMVFPYGVRASESRTESSFPRSVSWGNPERRGPLGGLISLGIRQGSVFMEDSEKVAITVNKTH
jgi:hypothetical protein